VVNSWSVIFTTLALYAGVTVSPGPNFALVSRLAVVGARKAAVGAALGFAVAASCYAILAMTGLSVLIKSTSVLASLIQVLGGLYLVYLGVSSWRTTCVVAQTSDPVESSKMWDGFRTGFLVDLANPKGIAFFISLYGASIPEGTESWAKIAIVAGGFFIEVLWYTLVGRVLSASAARKAYLQWGSVIDRTIGTLLCAFGLNLIWQTLRHET
jgi:threonine/homoserine/homoserine lactone efflux protein